MPDLPRINEPVKGVLNASGCVRWLRWRLEDVYELADYLLAETQDRLEEIGL